LKGIRKRLADKEVLRRQARQIGFISIGVFRLRYGRHFVYFREIPEEITVIRVLHESMDETVHVP
jgi:plasmid stabilization system protein ParE